MSAGVRSILIGVATSAVALSGLSGVAQADDRVAATTGAVITTLPAKALLNTGKTPAEFVKVKLAVPTGVTCLTGMTATVVGQPDAVTVPAAPDCTSVPGSAVWTVTANAVDKKREAVVKFVTTVAGEDSRKVGSLNVKVLAAAKSPSTDKSAATVYAAGAEVTSFPAKTVLLGGATPQFVTVKLAVPVGLTCPADLTTRVGAHRDAVTVSAVACAGGFATWTVTAGTTTHKRHAVVKFVTINPVDKARTVSTLNVSVNPTARPGKPAKGQGQQGQG